MRNGVHYVALELPKTMHSPFENMLHTNFIPSDAQCDNLRAFLVDPCKELAGLAEKISQLQAMLEETTKKHDELKQYVDAHLALLAPMRRLPGDILRAVFVETLPSTRNTAISPTEGPLLVSQVCRVWRSTALTTPRLWGSIHIVIPDHDRLHRLLDVVTSWLSRSGTVPLAVSVAFSRAWWKVQRRFRYDVSPVFTLLASVCRRWKDLEIIWPAEINGVALSTITSEDVPKLRSMTITMDMDYWFRNQDSDGPPPLALPFLAAQSLRSFTFDGPCETFPSPILWGSLEYLKLGFICYPERISLLWTILPQYTLLQSCDISIHVYEGYGEPPSPTEQISLPLLTYLSVTLTGNMDPFKFFVNWSLPRLASLCIPVGMDDLTMVLRLTHVLVHLDIRAGQMTSERLVDGLAAMPSLEDLTLRGDTRDDSESFLARLIPSLNGTSLAPTVCPRLRRIRLADLDRLSDALLVQFVHSRTLGGAHIHNVAPLTYVACMFERPMELDVEPQLRDAILGGLTMFLSYTTPDQEFSPRAPEYSPFKGIQNRAADPYDFEIAGAEMDSQ
ncbi:hypothetical protein GGX14DRAFT_651334 [Mycena pura]|uniref:F-box domain-containing protein n=1 Tax=Mycena pura TaxID=153505 RepID=A0AAD6YNM8_9AGAR|nr:hypothetical protein GGX14DRAFT_651334 [Mycena pura]